MKDVTDINVSYGVWPFREFDQTTFSEIVHHLSSQGIDSAYVSHLGAVFNPDSSEFNLQLIDDCTHVAGINPVLTINPAFPGWQKHIDDCRSRAKVDAVKIYPTYHNYSLQDEIAEDVVQYVRANDLRVMISMRLEDERIRYHGLNIVGLPVDDVVAFANAHDDLKLLCLNSYLPEAKRFALETTNVSVDTSFADWFFVLEDLRSVLPVERIFFGSHTPFLYTKACIDKIDQSRLPSDEKQAIIGGNARSFLERIY